MIDAWTWIGTTFNNREIATGLWFTAGLIVCLASKSVRSSLFDLVVIALNSKLVMLFGSFAANTAFVVWIVAFFGMWSSDQSAATVLWVLLSGLAMLGRALGAKEGEGYFRKLFWDTFKITGLFEFVVVAFSFSLLAELVVVPLLFLGGAMLAVAGGKDEYAKVKGLIEGILAIFIMYVLWKSVSQIWAEPTKFFTTQTGRNFLLPAFLMIGSIPIAYFWYCYSYIEQARIQIDLKTFQTDELKTYARKRFFLVFMARPWLLRRATRQFHTLPAKVNTDVDRIIQGIYTQERNAEHPPEVNPIHGWSPYLARYFLTEHDLETNDYHDGGYNDEWWASSSYIDLDEHILPNRAVFYLEGTEEVVKTLKLTGKFADEFDAVTALHKLDQIAIDLIRAALELPEDEPQTIVPDGFEYEVQSDSTTIKKWSQRYPGNKGFEVFITLSKS